MEPSVIKTPEELLAAIPHMLGFHARESLVVVPVSAGLLVPVSAGLPLARVDLPRTGPERDRVLGHLCGPYRDDAGSEAVVALVCLTEDRRSAELASRQLAAGLEKVGVATQVRIWATDERWVELNSGQAGARTGAAATRIAAEAVLAGLARPAANRESLAEALVGDRQPVARALPAARDTVKLSSTLAERTWAVGRLEQFHADGNRLSDPDATRLLVALQSTGVRDAMWADMGRDNARSHTALWTDLTRRAPDQVRTPAATLLAFSSWLNGNGARAWCALDQIPSGPPYKMASLIAAALQCGIHPAAWDQLRATDAAAEAFTPPPPDHRHRRDLPGSGPPPPGRGAPGR